MPEMKAKKNTPAGKLSVVDDETQKPLATFVAPLGWEVKSASINPRKSTLEIPYGIMIALENGMGSSILIDSGDSFANQDTVTYYYEQVPHTMQHDFETIDKYLDEYVRGFAKMNNRPIRFKEELSIPLNGYDRKADFIKHRTSVEQEAQSAAAMSGDRVVINGVYCDSACRAYSSGDIVLVAFAREIGHQAGLANFGIFGGSTGPNNGIQGFGGLVKNAKDKTVAAAKNSDGGGSILNHMADSGLLGGLFSRKYRSQPNRKVQQQPIEEASSEEGMRTEPTLELVESDVMLGRMNEPGQGEWLEWKVSPVFLLVTSKQEYDENINQKAFKQICSSFKYSPEVLREFRDLKARMEQENNASRQQYNATMRQNGEALIHIGQQCGAANQNYIESMMSRSDQQYQNEAQLNRK